MVRYMMECGHVIEYRRLPSRARGARDSRAHVIACPRCRCEKIRYKIKTVYDRLENRYAVCGTRKVRSRWDLPGFIYRPEEETDAFFYGVSKRVLGKGKIKIEGSDRKKGEKE